MEVRRSDRGVRRDRLGEDPHQKLGKLDQRWVEVVGKAEGSDEHIGQDHSCARRFRVVRREPESSRWRREVILEVAGCLRDTRPVGRTSSPDAFSRVAVFGHHAPAAPAAGTAAAEADLPAEEPPQPDAGWTDIAKTPITASRRRMYTTDAMVKKFGASMGCPRCQNGTGTHTDACRARMLSSMASQTSVAPQAPAVDIPVDRQGPRQEAKTEAMRIEEEMQSWVPLTTCRSRQAAAASRNRVRAGRFAGSWDSRPEPLRRSCTEEKEQPGAEEEALERKRQFEAVCPQMLEVGEVVAAPALEDCHPSEAGARHEVGGRAWPAGSGCRVQKAAAGARGVEGHHLGAP